eukprot:jgi/Tetstr1/423399/TSEL_014081.t2
MLFSRVLAHRETIARLTDADRTAFFDYTGRILRVLEDDSAARCMAAQAAPSNYTTPAELLSSTCASTHRWGNTSCRTYIKSYQGSKVHLDACSRPVSSPMHFANRAPLPTRGNPNRHQMEAYLVNMLTWHWKLLHVVDSPIFDNSQNGKRHVETILGVIGRIRFIHAIRKA